jgi:hypothetical protein
MTLETWDADTTLTYDQALWAELTSLRFVDGARGVFILGPVSRG